jgi:hypothetical protein
MLKIAIAFALSCALSLMLSAAGSGDLTSARRTLADLRTFAAAIEAYGADHKTYPSMTSITDLRSALEPKYVGGMPLKDGWGHEYRYLVSSDGRHYRVVSAGSDGVFQKDFAQISKQPPDNRSSKNFADDIVYQDGSFRRLPDALKSAFELHEDRQVKP